MFSKTKKLLLFAATVFLFVAELKVATGLNCWVCDGYDDVANQCSPKHEGRSELCSGANAVCELIEETYPKNSSLHGITYNLRACGQQPNLHENTSKCDPPETINFVTITRCYCNSEKDCNQGKIGEVGALPVTENESESEEYTPHVKGTTGNDDFFKDWDFSSEEVTTRASLPERNRDFFNHPENFKLLPSLTSSSPSAAPIPSMKNKTVENAQPNFNQEEVEKLLTNYERANPQNSSRLRCIQCDTFDGVDYQCHPEMNKGKSLECPGEYPMCELVQENYVEAGELYGKKFYLRKCVEGKHLVGQSGTCSSSGRISGVELTSCYCNDYNDCNLRGINGVGEEQPYDLGYGSSLKESTLRKFYNNIKASVKSNFTRYLLPKSCEKLVSTDGSEPDLCDVIIACMRHLLPTTNAFKTSINVGNLLGNF
ncbi:unnamed protein product [Orchesella dallaii]|uniref:Protein sleepless n=1 Tax=Orchesella dallaii TaxID=48710 RepID=A0ABP1PIV5_9HEXA